MQKLILIAATVTLLFSSCRDVRIKSHDEWGATFSEYGIKDACFQMRDNNHETIHYYNKERCTKRFTPASTFKIFNSLVALETAVAPDDQMVIKWDSINRRAECDKDITMNAAFEHSCLGYYQEIARRIGPGRMQHFLDTIKYGNMNMGGSTDSFWLFNNMLQVSADEQVGFLKKIYFYELPVSERSQRIVKNMMLREATPNYNLYYKTGTGMIKDKYIYWVVGFAERIQHGKEKEGSMNKVDFRNYPYFFALNFEMPQSDTTHDWFKVRLEIVHKLLSDYGALPAKQ